MILEGRTERLSMGRVSKMDDKRSVWSSWRFMAAFGTTTQIVDLRAYVEIALGDSRGLQHKCSGRCRRGHNVPSR
jgi:hypothetical protein